MPLKCVHGASKLCKNAECSLVSRSKQCLHCSCDRRTVWCGSVCFHKCLRVCRPNKRLLCAYEAAVCPRLVTQLHISCSAMLRQRIIPRARKCHVSIACILGLICIPAISNLWWPAWLLHIATAARREACRRPAAALVKEAAARRDVGNLALNPGISAK